MTDKDVLEQFVEDLVNNPNTATPANMDTETALFVRQLVGSETVDKVLSQAAQRRIWNRALANAQAKPAKQIIVFKPRQIQLAFIMALAVMVLIIVILPHLSSSTLPLTPTFAVLGAQPTTAATASAEPSETAQPEGTATETPGATRSDDYGITQVWVPAGCFTMGSDPAIDKLAQPNEQPAHQVCLTQGFWFDQTEVTNAAYQKFIDAGGYNNQQDWSTAGWQWVQSSGIQAPRQIDGFTAPQQPRLGVSWFEAEAYAHWRGGQLPTEAQWEYAARGPQSLIYPWGNDFQADAANINAVLGVSAAVGSYPKGDSWIKAEDMIGNVWEWTTDYYDGGYFSLKVKDDPTGPTTGDHRVAKGGSWDTAPGNARAAYRNAYSAASRDNEIGFRILSTQ